MGLDKYKSVKRYYRIKEGTLIGLAFFMGGFGSLIGSIFFKHKTKKLKFRVLLPLAIVFNIAILLLFLIYIF